MANVIVACRLPHGLQASIFDEEGNAVTHEFKGLNSVSIVGVPDDVVYGKTEVPQEFWDAWLEQNKGTDMVRNGFVFADAKEANVAAKAKSGAKNTGFEPMQPDADGVKQAEQ